MLCPYCEFDNIPGVDLCEECGSDLAGLDLPEASVGFSGRLLSDRIGALPLSPTVTVSPTTTVAETISLMRTEKQGYALVLGASGRLRGIFTEFDVLRRVVRRSVDPKSTAVSEVMTPAPVTLSPDDPPAYAIHRMVAEGFRHLPIAEGNSLVGLLSIRGVLSYVQNDVLGGAREDPDR